MYEFINFLKRFSDSETERSNLQLKIRELISSQEQLQISLEMSQREKETLQHVHETALNSNQEQELRSFELTNQIVTLVREKESMEEMVRQLQRDNVTKDKERDEIREKLELLQGQSSIQKGWMQEKEVVCLFYYMKYVV